MRRTLKNTKEIRQFVNHTNYKSLEEILELDDYQLREVLREYILYVRRKFSDESASGKIHAILKICKENNISFDDVLK